MLAVDHTNRGNLLYRDEHYEDALKESRLGVQIEPKFVDAHILQVRSLLKLRRYNELFRSCDAGLALPVKYPVFHELRGVAHFATHDYVGAMRDYSQALELQPNDARMRAERGWAYLMLESPTLALVDFEAAIKLNPDEGDGYNGRGTARAFLGDHSAAVADAREAVRHGGTKARIKYNAARIYAVAASVASAQVGVKGRQARLLATKYEDTALQLIREELQRQTPVQRAAFWKETIQGDPALKAIRRRLRFDDLMVTTK